MGIPNSLNVSTEDFACSGMTGFVVEVEWFLAASLLPVVENSDESFDVGCVGTEGKVLFLGDGVASCFVSVGHASFGVFVETDDLFQEDWGFRGCLEFWNGGHFEELMDSVRSKREKKKFQRCAMN